MVLWINLYKDNATEIMEPIPIVNTMDVKQKY